MSKESEFAKLCGDILKLAIKEPEAKIEFEYREPERQSAEVAGGKPNERSQLRADVVALKDNHIIAIADVKLYRSWNVPVSWLERAAGQLKTLKDPFKAPSAYLMVTSSVADLTQARIERWAGVTIIDRDGLYSYCGGRPDLIEALDSVLLGLSARPQELQPNQWVSLRSQSTKANFSEYLLNLDRYFQDSLPLETIGKEVKGERLCAALQSTKTGLKSSTEFERRVQEALEYVFNDQLSGWKRQSPVDDGLRMDIAAKIAGNHDFWLELIRDFRTRFVLFECKNYRNKFSQEQVYTTEKYLFRKALRSVAILVSPHGPDHGAEVAIKGAIRESGKIILWITSDELCEMLHLKDTGGEVHKILATRLDEILLTIAR